MNFSCSSWEEVYLEFQDSMLVTIPLNILLGDFFFVLKDTDFTSYFDGSTIYNAGGNCGDVIIYLYLLSIY